MRKKQRQPKGAKAAEHFPVIENRQQVVRLSLPPMERFLQRINRELGLSHQASSVCFITDAEMKHLNRKYRNKAKTTDVLSFPSELRSMPRSLRARTRQLQGSFIGDIAISPTVARRNSKTFGRTLSAEISILLLHGVLHLLGYDHETDRGEMDRVEATLRTRLGLH
jgi:probable rRNA maturation factor